MITKFTLNCTMAFFLLFSTAFGFSDDKKKSAAVDQEVCLEITGDLDESMRNHKGNYTVKLLKDNKVIEEIVVNAKDKFKLHLKRNTEYTIRLEKEGYIPRLVSVNTTLPKNVGATNLYRFHFDMQLFAEAFAKYFDPDDIDFPIALIAYDKNKGVFHYDKNYTTRIQEKMHNMSSRKE